MKAALLVLALFAIPSPGLAGEPAGKPQVTYSLVRAYVMQVGLVQAKANARAAGMTVAQQRQARRCLASKD